MTNNTHEEEPWEYLPDSYNLDGDGEHGSIMSNDDWFIARIENAMNPEANAKRIVSCVNAMAGIDDPERFLDEVKAYLMVINKTPPEGNDIATHYKMDRLMAKKALALFPTPKEASDE